MRAPAIFAAILLAGTARAQTPPAPETPAEKPAAEKAGTISAKPGAGVSYQTATDTVTLYGLLDITWSTADNANAQGDRKTGYQTSWFSGDRWGITGRHALTGDNSLAVIFKLEGEYVLNTGALDTDNVIFNRDAWIGFESVFGKFTFGRQNTVARDFSQNYGDPYGSARVTLDEGGWTNTNNFKQLIFYAGSGTGTRMDNSAVWKKKFKGDFGEITAGVGYQTKTEAGAFSKNNTLSGGLHYGYGPVNLSGFYTHANVNNFLHESYSVGGNVQIIPLVRLNAGWFHYTAEQAAAVGNRKDDAFTVSTKITPEGPFDFELGYQVLKAGNAGTTGSGATLNVLNPFADASAVTATGSGRKTTFYGSAFYHFDKRTEIYLAADRMELTDGYKLKITNGHANQTEVGLGLRFKF